MNQPLTRLALRVAAHPRTRQSFATLKRHKATPQGLQRDAAMRLLRRNVRDAMPAATYRLQNDIAALLYESLATE